ncbi:hypothetical protein HMPREF2943_07520 [Corynebacterium sp. HMSC072D12]|uniref:glycosyltransferase family 4 protein n=1 Tax=Corynebacterium sp. HMSC072D12 TaxID=1739447 RepID=UPI0008B32F7C|nr:glycosyltransferase family 4 protein [Corynebacterium sp. HMSC072D12]OFQ37360.1 hypothetical protein HMPREF2943_07520 [Corynebacterium sp. HMSC072D12]
MANRLKILVVSQYWKPENGIPQRRWAWLTKLLVDQGHDVLVVAPFPHYREAPVSFGEGMGSVGRVVEEGDAGERILRTGYIPARDSLTSRSLNQLSVAFGALIASLASRSPVRSFNPDVVIGTVPALPTAVVAYIISKVLRVKLVVDLRDAWPSLLDYSSVWNESTGRRSIREKVFSRGPLQGAKFLVKLSLNSVLKAADLIVVTANNLCSDLVADGIPFDRIATIRNVFPSEGEEIRRVVTRPQSPMLNVLYAGTIGRAQGLENALEAAELASNFGVSVNLRIVGAGAASSNLEELAKDSPAVITIEPLRDADALDELYEWADTALVHLKSWRPLESAIPSKTYELMERGIHITAVANGETAELVSTLEAGSVVPPENPQVLAETWVELSKHRDNLLVSDKGAKWVKEQRERAVPRCLRAIVANLSEG